MPCIKKSYQKVIKNFLYTLVTAKVHSCKYLIALILNSTEDNSEVCAHTTACYNCMMQKLVFCEFDQLTSILPYWENVEWDTPTNNCHYQTFTLIGFASSNSNTYDVFCTSWIPNWCSPHDLVAVHFNGAGSTKKITRD